MKAFSSEWHDVPEKSRRTCRSSAWGGVRALKALFFRGLCIVPETCVDMRSQTYDECHHHALKARQLCACALCCSVFGEQRLQNDSTHVPDCLQPPAAKLQRFCFNLRELHKANTYKRFVHDRPLKDKDVQREYLQMLVSNAHITVKPQW